MADLDRPLRLRILDALTASLKQITTANGYQHDLSSAVFRGRIAYGEDDPLPMVSILEPPVPPDKLPDPEDGTSQDTELELLIQGFVKDDKENPTDPAYILMADVKRRLAYEKQRPGQQGDGTFGRTLGFDEIGVLRIGSGTVRPADEVSAKAYFWLNITIQFAEDLDEPFE